MVIITNRTMMDVMVIIQVIHVMTILAPMATMAIIYMFFFIGCNGNSCSYELDWL